MSDARSRELASADLSDRPQGDAAASDAAASDDLNLLPPECPSTEEFLRRKFPSERQLPSPETPPPEPRFQFSLSELMVITLGVAVGVAGGTWMPPSLFAGIMSLVAMIGLLAVHFYPPETRGGWLVCLTVFLAYFVAVVVAVMRPAAG